MQILIEMLHWVNNITYWTIHKITLSPTKLNPVYNCSNPQLSAYESVIPTAGSSLKNMWYFSKESISRQMSA